MSASPDWLQVAHTVLLSRRLDLLEETQLAPQGKVKYQFSAKGHELAQVLLAHALTHPHDAATLYYRSRPFVLASGLSAAEALAAGMARQGGTSQGRDAGVMFNLPRRTGATILPSSGDVGAQYTPAAGWAQAVHYRLEVLGEHDWDCAMAVAMGGDASTAANGFWAALNIATTQCLPMLFFIEDNGYGISVPSRYQTPEGNIAHNLHCFNNLYTLEASGSDPQAAWEAVQAVVDHARNGRSPCLLRMRVPRLGGHTFVDTQAYKSAEERQDEAERDPLPRLHAFLLAHGILDEAGWAALEAQVAGELAQALEQAEAAPQPDPAETARHIFFEGQAPHQGGLRPEGALISLGQPIPQPEGPRINLIDAVRRTLEHEMAVNPRIAVFGEDVGVKGGVHGATLDMQAHYGIQRVFDTSLNEEGIMGRSVGMALAGLLPVPEIQFRKYADPAYEQINDLGSLRWRTANRFAAPVVVRIPVGFAKNKSDPWHCVNAEAVYAHTLGWRLAYPSNAEDAVGLLRTALRSDDPTFFYEHRALLDTPDGRRPYPGDDFCLPFGQAARVLQGSDLTVVSWGAMLHRCLEAASAFPGRIDLLDLRTIIPWDREAVLASVRRTGKLLIVHEDTLTAGFAGEITAVIADEAFTDLDAPIQRLAAPDHPTPYNMSLVEAALPTAVSIRQKITWLLDY